MVFTKRPEALTNDFFVNLLDMVTEWKALSDAKDVFEGCFRKTGAVNWTGTRADFPARVIRFGMRLGF